MPEMQRSMIAEVPQAFGKTCTSRDFVLISSAALYLPLR